MTTEFLLSSIPIRKLDDPGILMKLRISSRIRWPRISYIILQGFHLIVDFKDDTIAKYVMKLRFVVERKNGDIEAHADARRALKKQISIWDTLY